MAARRKQRRQGRPINDLWAPRPAPPEPRRIAPPRDATALVRSLGRPPLPGQAAAEHYLAAVVNRAAGIATALAAAADVLATAQDDVAL